MTLMLKILLALWLLIISNHTHCIHHQQPSSGHIKRQVIGYDIVVVGDIIDQTETTTTKTTTTTTSIIATPNEVTEYAETSTIIPWQSLWETTSISNYSDKWPYLLPQEHSYQPYLCTNCKPKTRIKVQGIENDVQLAKSDTQRYKRRRHRSDAQANRRVAWQTRQNHNKYQGKQQQQQQPNLHHNKFYYRQQQMEVKRQQAIQEEHQNIYYIQHRRPYRQQQQQQHEQIKREEYINNNNNYYHNHNHNLRHRVNQYSTERQINSSYENDEDKITPTTTTTVEENLFSHNVADIIGGAEVEAEKEKEEEAESVELQNAMLLQYRQQKGQAKREEQTILSDAVSISNESNDKLFQHNNNNNNHNNYEYDEDYDVDMTKQKLTIKGQSKEIKEAVKRTCYGNILCNTEHPTLNEHQHDMQYIVDGNYSMQISTPLTRNLKHISILTSSSSSSSTASESKAMKSPQSFIGLVENIEQNYQRGKQVRKVRRSKGIEMEMPVIQKLTTAKAQQRSYGAISGKIGSTTTISSSNIGSSSVTSAAISQPSFWHWPIKREAVVEGELILGGLMMVHSREDTVICGPIMPQGGIQALEAMLYTIDRINESGLLPNITLGAHVLDDCDKDTYGLEMAVDFIKGSISNIDDTEYYCNKTQVRKVISGVVGASSSVTSIQVANLLRLFRIPQVSFFSTSPELSNKQRFEYFTRTIPSDHYQVKAMVEIVKRMGWSYVSIIYEESNYGIKAFEELEELLARHSICIAVKEKLVKDSGVAEEIAYDNIVQKLLTKPRARGAIIFGSDQEVREVMRAVRRNNATGAFSWIGSDGWSARNLVSDGNEPEVEGTLSVQPQANPVRGFEEYFLNLSVENNQRNPWFVEFWEDHFQCRYPGSPSTPYNNYNRTCTTKEQLTDNNMDFEDQLQFVSDAVMAFAYALRDMHRDLCGGEPTLCDEMKPTKGADLLKYLRKVQFQGLSGDHFRFDANGDGPARYNIIHFKQSKEGQYHWVKIGEYYEGELRLNMSEVQFKLLDPKPPESVCSLPCHSGQAKKYVDGESCCWHCFNCSMYQIRDPMDETQCLVCKNGTLPNSSKQICIPIPEVYLRLESAWAIGAMTFSLSGILLTLFIVGVFLRHNNTPIVRASGRELSYILLAGILMCYAVTFALVLKPTNLVCAIQRFSVGFCFTVVYAALLTKTNRIARIFKAGKQSAKRPSFISPKSQLVICSFLIFIQILINGIWMIIAYPHAMHHHPTREDNLLVCDSYIDASYMIAFFYPIVLIIICTVYAVLTRKIPEAFNESKHIGFTMYTTCVIWLAFVPLYFGTANHVPLRITSMSVTISLSASVTIACLFSPKLYIILVRPERNVRQSMMPSRCGNIQRPAGTGQSSMMAAAVVTAATCPQENQIQQHITPTSIENECTTKTKKLCCEMATQTITLSNIIITLDSNTYNAIPFADQYIPNNNDKELPNSNDFYIQQKQQQQQQQQQEQQLNENIVEQNNYNHRNIGTSSNGNSNCSSISKSGGSSKISGNSNCQGEGEKEITTIAYYNNAMQQATGVRTSMNTNVMPLAIKDIKTTATTTTTTTEEIDTIKPTMPTLTDSEALAIDKYLPLQQQHQWQRSKFNLTQSEMKPISSTITTTTTTTSSTPIPTTISIITTKSMGTSL